MSVDGWVGDVCWIRRAALEFKENRDLERKEGFSIYAFP